MPIYEYHCKSCGHKFEEIVFGDETPKCPKCASGETEKLMSRCCCRMNGSDSDSFEMPEPPAGGGCSGCSGGSCASCGGSCGSCH